MQPDVEQTHGSSDTSALIARYKDGYREVAAALEGASDTELDARPAPGTWTAREIVHHLADSEMTSAVRLRLLVAEENAAIRPYDEKEFASRLHYDRPDRQFAACVSGRAPVDGRAARRDDRCRFRQERARIRSTGATASSAGSRSTPSTRTSTPIRFAGPGPRQHEPILHLLDHHHRVAIARDVGVFRSHRARNLVADVAIGHGAARARRVRGGMGADGVLGRDARHGLEARFTAR